MKKLIALMAVAGAGLGLTACKKEKYEIALVTDSGTIDDGSFNQGSWEGVEQYAQAKGISHKYYQPAGESTPEYIKTIELAIKGGAKTVVTPGFYFENSVWTLQSKYPNVKFILVDGTPHNMANWDTNTTVDGNDYNEEHKDNVVSLLFAEDESGFLAGYALVQAGFTQLGFVGGKAVPAVQRFGYGFVLGAQTAAAAKTPAIADNGIEVKYTYANSFAPSDTQKNNAATWYSAGTEVIFAAAGGVGASVMGAAEDSTTKKYVVGVDIDQSAQSDTVLTSALKQLKVSVNDALKNIYEEDFSWGGTVHRFDSAANGVGLPTDFSRFTTAGKPFTAQQYEQILKVLKEINKTENATLKAEFAKLKVASTGNPITTDAFRALVTSDFAKITLTYQ